MAKNNDLSKLLRKIQKEIRSAPFKPNWYYNKEGDSIKSFWEETNYYAKRINNSITLYIDEQTGRVNGVLLKNVKYALRGDDANTPHRGD